MPLLLILTLIFLVLTPFITQFMMVATLAYFTMILGLKYRKNRSIHPKLMATAIFLDLAVVLVLQVQRSAIETAISFKLGYLQQFHILFSSLATALYIPVLILGILLLKKRVQHLYQWHVRLALLTFFFRTLGFFLMFTLLFKK